MELKQRKPNRIKEYDYSSAGAYFITICVKGKHEMLGKIVGDGVPKGQVLLDVPKIKLSEYGIIVENQINLINATYNNISINKYVIMPDHIHMIIFVYDTENGTKTPSDNGTKTPLDNGTKTPLGNGTKTPLGNGTKTPLGNGTKTPLGNGTKTPLGNGTKTPLGNGTSRTPSPTNAIIPSIVSTFKRFTNKTCGFSLFQRSFYDRIIRNEREYLSIWQYIETNPLTWALGEHIK